MEMSKNPPTRLSGYYWSYYACATPPKQECYRQLRVSGGKSNTFWGFIIKTEEKMTHFCVLKTSFDRKSDLIFWENGPEIVIRPIHGQTA